MGMAEASTSDSSAAGQSVALHPSGSSTPFEEVSEKEDTQIVYARNNVYIWINNRQRIHGKLVLSLQRGTLFCSWLPFLPSVRCPDPETWRCHAPNAWLANVGARASQKGACSSIRVRMHGAQHFTHMNLHVNMAHIHARRHGKKRAACWHTSCR